MSPPRASPFVGLSETSLRFLLLSLVTFAGSLYAWHYIYLVLTSRSSGQAMLGCTTASQEVPSPPYRTEYTRCWAENVAHPLALGIGLGLALTIAVSFVVFLVLPPLRVRLGRGYAPPPAIGEPLQQEVNYLAGVLGVRPPRVLLQPRVGTAQMLAGGLAQPTLVLSDGMVGVFHRERDRFRAVVAHELGHIRNADVRLTELAQVTFWTFLVAVCLPYVVAALLSGYFISTIPVVIKFVLVAALVWLLRNALLRSREHEADIRASCLPAARRALTDLLRSRPSARRTRLTSPHPPAAARVTAIEEPDVVLRASPLDLVSLGAIGYFLVPAVSFWLQQMSYGRPLSTTLAAATSWLAGAAVGAGVWAICWRQAVAERVTGRRPGAVLAAAASLTVGLFVGAFLIPVPRERTLVDSHSPAQWLAFGAVAFAASALLIMLSLRLADRLAGSAGDRPMRLRHSWLGLVIVASITAAVLDTGQRFVMFSVIEAPLPTSALGALAVAVLSPANWVIGLAVLSGIVLAARRPRLPAGVVPEWMILAESAGTEAR